MKLVDLCCGCGGLSLGMFMSNHQVISAFDNDPAAVDNYNLNIAHHARLANLNELSADDLPDCDGIIGGPPCQPFSNGHRNEITRKGPSDERNALPDFVRLVVEKRPRFFLIENVPGLLQYPAFVAEQLGRLFQAGYFPVPAILTAWKFGVPQERKRLFIMGYLNGKLPQWPTPTTNTRDAGVSTWATVGDMLTQETSRPKPPWIERKFQGRDRIITDTRNRGYTPHKGRYFHARSIDLPSYTVLASERRGSKVIVIGNRCWQVTADHNRKLQTFPDSWQFPDNNNTAQRLIGNAVPPLLAQRIGQVIT